MAKPNKFNVDMDDFGPPDTAASERTAVAERHDTNGLGWRTRKQTRSGYKQYPVLLRVDTHSRVIKKLQQLTAKPNFGKYVESLILRDVGRS